MKNIPHYFRSGFRGFRRQKTISIINIIGLSAGISSFILILLFLQNELGYENHIPERDSIYRLVEIQKPAGIDVQHVAITSGPWATVLKENLPEVSDALRLTTAQGDLFRADGKVFTERLAFYAESQIIRFFNINLVAGRASNILDEPNTAVISERTAERFFGNTDVVGRSFRMGDTPYQVTGVMENYDYNSHLQFEVLLSYSTFEKATPELANFGTNFLATYLLLQPGTPPEKTEANILDYIDSQFIELGLDDEPRPEMYLQPLTDIHLKSHHIKFSIFVNRGDIILVYVFSLVAFLILFIACINYINLSTARATKRSLEVGMRKTLGASPSGIFLQFMGESLITAFIALILSIGLVELFLPQFNTILNTDLQIDFAGNPLFNVGLLAILAVVGLLSGVYPSFFMSRFKPVTALKNQAAKGRSSGWQLRMILVTLQFSVSAMLIFATLVFYSQWTHMRNHDLGINYENIISLPLMHESADTSASQSFKSQLLSHPGIEAVSLASGPNGVSGTQSSVRIADSFETELMVRLGYVDEDFFPAMEIEIIEGRNFSSEYGTDASRSVIINACAARTLGWDQAVGRQFIDPLDSENYLTVIGVVNDYNFYSLHGEIEPALFRIWPARSRTLIARINPLSKVEALQHMKMRWEEFFIDIPFDPVFVAQNIELQYQSEANAMRVITFFAILGIIISALGLYGLTAFTAEQKRKEIGIRKVLGESVISIVAGMQKMFLGLVLIALIIGLPLAYIYMMRWLDNFAYRIDISGWYFILSAAVVLLTAFLTVLAHSLRAARANPVESIKYE